MQQVKQFQYSEGLEGIIQGSGLNDTMSINYYLSLLFKGIIRLPSDTIDTVEFVDTTSGVSYETYITSGGPVKQITVNVDGVPYFSIKMYVVDYETVHTTDKNLEHKINKTLGDIVKGNSHQQMKDLASSFRATTENIENELDLAYRETATYLNSNDEDVIPLLGYELNRRAKIYDTNNGSYESKTAFFEIFPYIYKTDYKLDSIMVFYDETIKEISERIKTYEQEYLQKNDQIIKLVLDFIKDNEGIYDHPDWIAFSDKVRKQKGFDFLSDGEIGLIAEFVKKIYRFENEEFDELLRTNNFERLKNTDKEKDYHVNPISFKYEEYKDKLLIAKKKRKDIIDTIPKRVASFQKKWTDNKNKIEDDLNNFKKESIHILSRLITLSNDEENELYEENKLSLTNFKKRNATHVGRICRYVKYIVGWMIKDQFWDNLHSSYKSPQVNNFTLSKNLRKKLLHTDNLVKSVKKTLMDRKNTVVSHEDLRPHHIFVQTQAKQYQQELTKKITVFDLNSVEEQRIGRDIVEILTSTFIDLSYNKTDEQLEKYLKRFYLGKKSDLLTEDVKNKYMRSFYWLRFVSRLGKAGITANTRMKNVKNIYRPEVIRDPDLGADYDRLVDINPYHDPDYFINYQLTKLEEDIETVLNSSTRPSYFKGRYGDISAIREFKNILSNIRFKYKGHNNALNFFKRKESKKSSLASLIKYNL